MVSGPEKQEIEYLITGKVSKILKTAAFFLALSLICGGGLPLYASSTQQQLEDAKQQANQMQGQITQGKEDLENLEEERDKIISFLSFIPNENDVAVWAGIPIQTEWGEALTWVSANIPYEALNPKYFSKPIIENKR